MGRILIFSEPPAFLSEVPKERIVHLKGYGVGNLTTEEYDDAIVSDLHDLLGDRGVLAWDGDLFHKCSFTRILDKLLASVPVRAVSFCFADGCDVFKENWSERVEQYKESNVHLVLLKEGCDPRKAAAAEHKDTTQDDEGWLALGRSALRITGSKTVVAVGGGGVAAMEAAAAKEEGTRWIIYRVHRGANTTDFGSLYKRAVAERWSHVEVRILSESSFPHEEDHKVPHTAMKRPAASLADAVAVKKVKLL